MFDAFSHKTPLPIGWKTLNNLSQIEDLKRSSHHEPIVIFKHSTRCSRSAYAMHKLEVELGEATRGFELYYLDLLSHRDISNAISQTFQVGHQSPQVLIIKDGIVCYSASHESINGKKLLSSL